MTPLQITPPLPERPKTLDEVWQELTRGFSVDWHMRYQEGLMEALQKDRCVKSNGYIAIARVNTWE